LLSSPQCHLHLYSLVELVAFIYHLGTRPIASYVKYTKHLISGPSDTSSQGSDMCTIDYRVFFVISLRSTSHNLSATNMSVALHLPARAIPVQRLIGTQPMETRLPKLLFSQQTVLAEQADPLPTPTTLMGEQVRPRRTLGSCSTTPIELRRAAPEAELAASVDWQH